MIGPELEIEKIDDMSETQPVGHIPDDAGQQQHPACLHQISLKVLSHHDKRHKGHRRQNDKKQVAVMKHAKCSTRIVDMGEREKAVDYRDRFLKGDEAEDQDLCELIQHRQNQNHSPW